MTPTYFLLLMLSFFCLIAAGLWLFEGYEIDRERDRQARLDIAFKIAKQTEKKNKNDS
jgi:hypothetical protein